MGNYDLFPLKNQRLLDKGTILEGKSSSNHHFSGDMLVFEGVKSYSCLLPSWNCGHELSLRLTYDLCKVFFFSKPTWFWVGFLQKDFFINQVVWEHVGNFTSNKIDIKLTKSINQPTSCKKEHHLSIQEISNRTP